MPDALHPGRRANGHRVFALCVCLGLFLFPVCAAAAVQVVQAFEPRAASNQRNTRVTLTFRAPGGFETAGGEARLLAASDQDAEAIPGVFETSEGVATAIFEVRRDWEEKSFSLIELAGQSFDLRPSVTVGPIEPRELKVEPDLGGSTEKDQVFRVTSSEALEDGAMLCRDGLSVKQESLKVTAGRAVVKPEGLDVKLAIQRPETEIVDATLVLEVCGKSARWVYTGRPLNLRTVTSHALNIEVNHGSDGAVDLILRPDVVANGSAGEAKVLDGPEKLAGLSPDTIVAFRREGDAYLAEIPVDCTAGELILGKLTLMAHYDQGDVRLFQHPGGVAVCPPIGFWGHVRANSLTWSLIGGIIIGLLGLIGYLSYDLMRSRHSASGESHVPDVSPLQEPPLPTSPTGQSDLKGLLRHLSDTLLRELSSVEQGIKELKTGLSELRERIPGPPDPTVPAAAKGAGWESRDGLAFVSERGAEATLAELVNRWWREGADRNRADSLIRSPAVKTYRSVDINESLRNLTNRTFTFQITDGPMEWLGQQQQGELLIVPCDPRLFETGDSLKFLGILFEGVNLERNPTKVRFRRVLRPCRLHRDPGSQDRYRLAQRGQIELGGQTELASTVLAVQPAALARVPQGSPPAPAGMSETKLARIVQDAVAEAVPRTLPARVEELARQVLSLLESEPRRAEPARFDPDIAAALDVVRKGVAAFEGQLRTHATAIQEVKSLVEALRGDLFRIESELHHLDPAPPVSKERTLLSDPIKVSEIDNALDRLVGPTQPLSQVGSLNMIPTPWRSPEPVQVPQQVLEKLEKWWPARLPSAESSPDGDQLSEPSAYLWRLEETQRVLARVCQQRGWEVSLVHLSVPEGSAQSDTSLQITEPVTVSRDYRSANFRGSSFSDALLFQFALSIHGDAGRHIALLPAAGLRVDRHHHAYSRLTLGKLPESAMRLVQVTQPAVLSPAGQSGLYMVASPLKAEFR